MLFCHITKAFEVDPVGRLERMHNFNFKALSEKVVQVVDVTSTPLGTEIPYMPLIIVSFILSLGCFEVFLELLILIGHLELPFHGHIHVILSSNR